MRNGRKPKIPLISGLRYNPRGEFFDDDQLLTLTAVADLPAELARRRVLIHGAKRGEAECISELQRRYRCRVLR